MREIIFDTETTGLNPGVTLPDSKAQLTLDVVKSRIDEWAAAMAQMVQRRSE